MSANSSRFPITSLFFVALLSYAYFFQAGLDNENARLAQARSLAETGVLTINRYANSSDVVSIGGDLFPNKAPGITLLSAPLWFVTFPIAQWAVEDTAMAEHISCHLLTIFLSGIPSALLVVMLFLTVRHFVRSERIALLLAVGYGLGTIAFPFATLLFSHQLSAALLFGAFFLVLSTREQVLREPWWRDRKRLTPFMAGGFAGFAITTEYPAALAVICITGYALFRAPNNRFRSNYLIGLGAGLLPLVIYNLLAFGDLFFIPYSAYTADGLRYSEHAYGLWGVQLPSINTLVAILFSLQRGLFVVNPWLTPALIAIPYVCFQKHRSPELLLCASVTVLFLLFNAGFGNSIVYWGGGASVGPRHLIPMLPFTVLLLSALLHHKVFQGITGLLIPLSVATMVMATATEPRVPYDYQNPLTDLFWENFKNSRLSTNVQGTFSSELTTENSTSYNLGKILGLPEEATLAPLFLLWLCSLPFLWKRYGGQLLSRYQIRYALAILFVLLAVPPLESMKKVISGKYSQGLLASYRDGIAWVNPNEPLRDPVLSGRKILGRGVDPQVILPAGELRKRQKFYSNGDHLHRPFSIEWNGYLIVEEPGDYYIGTQSDDGSAVLLNGKVLVNNWGEHPRKRVMERIHLSAGAHRITVRYVNLIGGGEMYLLWSPPFQHTQPIPADSLRLEKTT